MEEEGVEIVLAKAIELRLKVTNCIHKASTGTNNINGNSLSSEQNKLEKERAEEGVVLKGEKEQNPSSQSLNGGSLSEADEEDEENERLFIIRDALESLEHQLSNLQDLQRQHRYEREVALSEIEQCRKMLLDKLKEYAGEDLEVIQEASAFAGETVEHNSDLLLPPYPNRPPQSLVIDNHYLSYFPSTRKPVQNGVITGEAKKKLKESERNKAEAVSKNSSRGLGHFIGAAVKTVITIFGVISVLSLSGVGPSLGKRSIPFKFEGLFQQPTAKEERHNECPPGKVLVMEGGEARCIVKERIAIPFESLVAKPDINYGCG
ncbi:plastid division protein PDV2 [Manihot esculenta]|uniref:Uncharacterized protein n=2 Tax=Manihot esculenta TaxID=3983 RepID=A0ACB7GD40_MANES|nr:plastid division protein PDV2 [Manihot esculenta]XP_021593531.1 plastid division protein PDV2 [Manihot esculenta]KAG8637640.1 hypothetical protein MANES_15G147100v8 [Manihot esculenta]OAY29467.1 hypothetical protein MANES_15G147100v8 [Manihot esculenta]